MKVYLTLIAATLAATLCAPASANQPKPYLDRQQQPELVAPQADIPGATGLVFNAVEPCRMLDTRVPSLRSGRLAANSERDFLVFLADFALEQGGAEGGCDIPDTVRAVAINLTAVGASGRGFVTAWDYGAPRPATATINLIPGEDVNNQLTVVINPDDAEPDMVVYSFASTHLVADIVGYFTQPEALALECMELNSDPTPIAAGIGSSVFSPFCPAGYTRTGGACLAGAFEVFMVTSQGDGNRHFCAAKNTGLTASTITAGANCCRVPGN